VTIPQTLKKRRDFLRLNKAGKVVRFAFVCRYGHSNRTGQQTSCRLGVTASKKIGNAVHRNRAKRRLREAMRLHHHLLIESNVDINMIARPAVLHVAFDRLATDIKNVFLDISKAST
jgi:ribonuclease P protein component